MDKITYNKICKEVVEKYKLKILPRCRIFEDERKKKKIEIIIIMALSITVAIMIAVLTKNEEVFKFSTVIITLAFSGCAFIAKNFENKIKTNIMKYFCSCFENLKWLNDKEFLPNNYFIACSNLFKTDHTSTYEYDDVFVGSYNEVDFEILELKSYTITRSSKGRRSRHKQFKGAVIKIKIDKSFKGNTVIRPDTLLHFSPSSSLKHTVLEDTEFEKKFDVFTNDEVEARYLITASFMERLNNLKVAFKTDKISCSFYDGHILIGLHSNKDLFKFASITKSLLDYSEFSQMFKEIISIYEMIDYFKFSEKTKI